MSETSMVKKKKNTKYSGKCPHLLSSNLTNTRQGGDGELVPRSDVQGEGEGGTLTGDLSHDACNVPTPPL